MDINIYILGGLMSTYVVSKAARDVVAAKFKTSLFKDKNVDWWHTNRSWRNKYHLGNPNLGARFFLSTSLLKFTTDAWHMFNAISQWCVVGVLLIALYDDSYHIVHKIVAFLVMNIFYTLLYDFFYKKYFRRYVR